MMGALLALIPGKDLAYGAIIVALLAAFGAYTIHERHIGAAHETAALKASSAKLQAETDKKTADLQARANMAEQAYEKEHLLTVNQPVPVVRVCHNANSGSVVSNAGPAKPGNEGAGPAAGSVQPMPSGDSSVAGPDIGGMLSALAQRADEISATLREFQTRGNH
jgi:hypothetical protein